LAALILPLLRTESRAYRSREDRVRGVIASERRPTAPRWSWTASHKPGGDRIIRSAGWDSDGHCLVATTRGLEFWNGIEWVATPTEGLLAPEAIRFVHRMSAGRWLVGGDNATAAVLSTAGVTHVLRRPHAEVRFDLACGEIDDLAVLIGSSPGQPTTLYAVCGGRWLKPLPLDGVQSVSSLARLDDTRWLLAGRSREGAGFAAIATPTEWEVAFIGVPTARALLACAGHRDRGTGLVAGTEGMAVHIDDSGVRGMQIEGAGDLASAAVDVAGMEWAGGAGQIWARAAAQDASWQLVWQDSTWTAPLMSLFADVGIVLGLSVDGGVIEGRIEGSIAAAAPRHSKPW
jgi:eukaryotic-like serine/threonine-protein kinase